MPGGFLLRLALEDEGDGFVALVVGVAKRVLLLLRGEGFLLLFRTPRSAVLEFPIPLGLIEEGVGRLEVVGLTEVDFGGGSTGGGT